MRHIYSALSLSEMCKHSFDFILNIPQITVISLWRDFSSGFCTQAHAVWAWSCTDKLVCLVFPCAQLRFPATAEHWFCMHCSDTPWNNEWPITWINDASLVETSLILFPASHRCKDLCLKWPRCLRRKNTHDCNLQWQSWKASAFVVMIQPCASSCQLAHYGFPSMSSSITLRRLVIMRQISTKIKHIWRMTDELCAKTGQKLDVKRGNWIINPKLNKKCVDVKMWLFDITFRVKTRSRYA